MPVYPLPSTLWYVLSATKKGQPSLLWWCPASVAAGVLLPVLTMYLPTVVVAQLTAGAGTIRLLSTVLLFTLSMAFLAAVQNMVSQQIRIGKAAMGNYYIRLIAAKSLNTDYPNLEKEAFRKLQLTCYQACDAGGSAVRIVYECMVSIASNALGFTVYFVILARMDLWVVLFIVLSSILDYLLDRRVWKWDSEHRSELAGYNQKLAYIDTKTMDPLSAKDIRLYRMQGWLDKIYTRGLEQIHGWYERKHQHIFQKDFKKCLLSFLREGVAYAYLLIQAVRGNLSAADFVLYFAAIMGFSGWLLGLLGQMDLLNQCNIAISQLRGYFDYPETFLRKGGLSTQELRAQPKTLELRHVSYRYPGAKKIRCTISAWYCTPASMWLSQA